MSEQVAKRVQAELQTLVPILEELTGLNSRWNGEIYLVQSADFLGKKPFPCHIELDADLANLDVRWRTLLHELLHSLSAGYNQNDYNLFYGWEEGVVEQLQRLIRLEALTRCGIIVAEEIFTSAEAGHPFNPYIAALEKIREAINDTDARAFYVQLLNTPIKNRHASLLQSGLLTRDEGGRRIMGAVSTARVILERRIR
ncbi:MAG TPA: hypothetical protein VKU00_34105 [Chthonomonadaceae bacterium]|nr:hypothetical protein [Chthonomonadaceae bacterium]